MSLKRFGLDMTGTTGDATVEAKAEVVVQEDATVASGDGMQPAQVAKMPTAPDRAGFLRRIDEGAGQIRRCLERATAEGRRPTALVFSDMDVDGITSHTIMRATLERLGFDVEPLFSKKFSDAFLEKILGYEKDLLVITDHASPARDVFGEGNVMVLDHHKPPDPSEDHSHQLHPMLFGLNGSTEVCSAGIAYLLARALDAEGNKDLSVLGVIGSAGDMMDLEQGRFIGITASDVVGDAERFGLIERKTDVRLYGRHGRSLVQLLQYADDPRLRGLSKNAEGCQRFLMGLGLNPDQRWCDLDQKTKGELVGHLLDRASDPGRLMGEVYELCSEQPRSYLRDVREYSTVINGSSRYEMAEPVVAVLLGDRGRQYELALDNYLNHKRNIAKAIQTMQRLGIREMPHLQWVHVEGMVRHTIVGSVAGAVQSRHHPDKPIIAFAYEANDLSLTKVSGRGHRQLCEAGLDLSEVMRECAAALGGRGGGHDVAAGATIPAGTEQAFLEHAEQVLARQMDR